MATVDDLEEDEKTADPEVKLDLAVLRQARPDNVERLARALHVTVPNLRDPFARHLVLTRNVADALAVPHRPA